MLHVRERGVAESAICEPHVVGKPAEVAEHDRLVVDGGVHPFGNIIQGFRSECKHTRRYDRAMFEDAVTQATVKAMRLIPMETVREVSYQMDDGSLSYDQAVEKCVRGVRSLDARVRRRHRAARR